MEGKIILKQHETYVSPAQALAILMACYYIFNIDYPAQLKNVYLMLEATMMDQPQEAKKRVVENKFLQEISYGQI